MPQAKRDTLELLPRPSLILRIFIVVSHGLAVVVCGYLLTRNLWAAALLLPLAYSLFHCLRRQQPDYAHRIQRLLWLPDGQWRWYTFGGHEEQGRHLASSLRLPWLVILHLRSGTTKRLWPLVLPYDSLPGEQHRRLRVRLRVDSLAQPG